MDFGIIFTQAFLVAVLASGIKLAIPILTPALGEIYGQRSGVMNLGIEGIMLAGAIAGFVETYNTGNYFLGIFVGALVGALMGLVLALLCVTLGLNQSVIGFAIYFVGWGLSSYLFRIFFGPGRIPSIGSIKDTPIPVLSQIPIIGKILFNQNIFVYFTLLLVPISAIILFRTTWGLKIRAVGENPLAADAAGINVYLIRYACVIFSGAMSGYAGALIALQLGTFMEMVTGSRGWVAFAIVIFSQWSPYKALFGALLFGCLSAFQLALQAHGFAIPPEFLAMLPYVLTIVALLTVKKARPPSAFTKPYKRG